jgi:hypothetical protein
VRRIAATGHFHSFLKKLIAVNGVKIDTPI